MNRLLLALILVLPVMLLASESEQIAQAARLTNFTKSSTVAQLKDDFQPSNGFMITDPDRPFRFQKVGKIRKITRITITVTLFFGQSGPGEFDHNQLTLALDGIDTGLVLNGFRAYETDRQTISGYPNNGAQLRAALQADGKLHATIVDHTADPPNSISGHDENDATLVLQGKQRS